jgi:hypothetical protein
MPIPYILEVALQIALIIHAARTGRPYYWIMILLFIPLMGSVAYVIVELLPGATRSPVSRRTVGGARRLIDPEGAYRRLAEQLDLTPTIDNRRALAEECIRLGRLDEAETLYRDTLTGMHATDPYLMLGLARVQFERGDANSCLETLSRIRAANPDFQDADAHMLYARSLEATGDNERALSEYEALTRYFGGEEPRVRRGLLLRKLGDMQKAQLAFEEVKRSVERGPSFYRRNQQSWYRLAKDNLRG